MKHIGLFAAGVLFGTAAAIRAKDCVMKAVTNVREGAEDIYADAKDINAKRAEAEAAAVIEDAPVEEA